MSRRPFRFYCALLIVVAVLSRLPFFFEAVLDWDESTYLLMGADILEGHLPYVHAWEIKPPLAFLPYAFAAAIGGKTVLGVRLVGLLLVAFSGCLLYRLVRRLFGAGPALWSALMLVLYFGAARYFQATLTEHVALPLILLHLWWLLGPRTPRTLIAAGVALGCAVLVRTNLAYVSFASALALVVLSGRGAIRGVPLLAAGALLPVAAVAGVYAAAGHFDLLVLSAIKAPLAYATENASIGYVAWDMWFGSGLRPYSAILWVTFAAGAVLAVLRARGEPDLRRPVVALGLVLAAILFSLVSSGRHFPHYLLQAVPVLAIGAGVALDRLWRTRLRLLAPLPLLVLAATPATQYVKAARQAVEAGTLFYGQAYDVARFLNERGVEGKYVYFLNDHIGYHLTGARVPTYIIHPSNVIKTTQLSVVHGPDTTPAKAVAAAFAKRPVYVVFRPNSYLLPGTDERRVLEENLARDYRKVAEFGTLLVYERVP